MAPGIGIGIGIGAGLKSGFDFVRYWTTLISATVENAAPTHVVLTFPEAAAYVAADLTATVNGVARAVSSASWTGAVWTVVLASAVLYGDVVVVTFVPSGGTAAVTNNITHPLVIEDGHTAAWYDYSDASTLTDDGGGLISKWEDKLGSGNDLLSAGGARPTLNANGVLFSGSQHMQSGAFTLNSPFSVYAVLKMTSYVNYMSFFDGRTDLTFTVRCLTTSPQVQFAASVNSDMVIGNYAVIVITKNGAVANGSKFQVDENAAVLGTWNANAMGGVTLAQRGAINGVPGRIEVKEIILRDQLDTTTDYDAIRAYLKKKHSI